MVCEKECNFAADFQINAFLVMVQQRMNITILLPLQGFKGDCFVHFMTQMSIAERDCRSIIFQRTSLDRKSAWLA